MKTLMGKIAQDSVACIFTAVLTVVLGTTSGARADQEDAKKLVKAMSDYMASQMTISFAYDANLEVVSKTLAYNASSEIVTKDRQKIALVSSGTVTLNRPDKIRATRFGGFANVEMLFDAKTLTLLGKNANLYTQVDIPGTIDHLIDELRNKYDTPLPAADLLMTNIYDQLMPGVLDIKDLGSGVVGGIECDHLAFQTKEVDWQIWIAQGDRPYPCLYIITSKLIADGPQYTIQIRDWKTGNEVAANDFSFNNLTNAKKIDLKELTEMNELPDHYSKGGAQ